MKEKNKKKKGKVCRFQKKPYLCIAFGKESLLKKRVWRGGRVVDCGGLENRCTARYPGFESLSLRNKGCKSSVCKIYTLFAPKNVKLVFLDF